MIGDMRILFTGGSGKAGKYAVEHLIGLGHRVTNLDLVPLDHPSVHNLCVDLTDAGQVFNAFLAYAGYDELDLQTGSSPDAATAMPRYDAVVHFAAVPAILIRPDNETYRVNVLSTYNVLDAAVRHSIPKVVFASSETTYGVCFAGGEVRPDYLPVDEDHPTIPHDSYAMSKVVNEATARSFQARSGLDIYGLRINNVIEPHEYQRDFGRYVTDPGLRRRNIFAYIDARDLAQMVERCLVTDGLGYQVFNVANDDTSVGIDSAEVIERFYGGVPLRRPIEGHQSLYAIDRARDLVGFNPSHGWRHLLT